MLEFLKYFQLLVLVIYTVLLLTRLATMKFNKGINAISIINNKGIQRFIGIAIVTIINIWVATLLLHVIRPDNNYLPELLDTSIINSAVADIFGIIIIILGLIIYIAAWYKLSNSWRIGLDEQSQATLVTSGVYKISRNPMYVFYSLYLTGTFFINGTIIFLLFAIALAASMHFLILEEEKSLLRTHGDVYDHYLSVTDRYFTWKTPRNYSK
jgi:protein-S-isoprenylcysteine O-methyltransferase Ste14